MKMEGCTRFKAELCEQRSYFERPFSRMREKQKLVLWKKSFNLKDTLPKRNVNSNIGKRDCGKPRLTLKGLDND